MMIDTKGTHLTSPYLVYVYMYLWVDILSISGSTARSKDSNVLLNEVSYNYFSISNATAIVDERSALVLLHFIHIEDAIAFVNFIKSQGVNQYRSSFLDLSVINNHEG